MQLHMLVTTPPHQGRLPLYLMLCHTSADSIQPSPGKKSVRRSAVASRTFQYCVGGCSARVTLRPAAWSSLQHMLGHLCATDEYI